MRIIFSFKMFQIWCRFQKWNQNWEKLFYFSNSCIWIGRAKFWQSWTKYFPSVVNVLILTRQISLITSGDIFQINFPEKNEKTWSKRSHGAFAGIWHAFTCWLSMCVLKRRLLGSGLSKFFTACNFGNILAMTIMFCFKMFKIWCRFQKWNKKLRKGFLFFR